MTRKRLADLASSTSTREPVSLSFGEETFDLDLRLLSVGEEADVLVRARLYAIEKGIAEPSEADALYELGKAISTVARALVERVEKDSPTEAPEVVFENEQALLDHPLVTKEHIAYLYARYTLFADTVSPRKLSIDSDHFALVLARSAEDDLLPFCSLRPGAQWSFVRTLARLHLASVARSSPASTSSPEQ